MSSISPRRSGILFGQLKVRRKCPEISAVELLLRRIEAHELERDGILKRLYEQLDHKPRSHVS